MKPLVCFTMFCSFRLLPAQTRVIGISWFGNSVTSWFMVNRVGLLTIPVTSTVQVSHLPWLQTWWSGVGVHEPSKWLLEVKGVFSDEADHGRVALHPIV